MSYVENIRLRDSGHSEIGKKVREVLVCSSLALFARRTYVRTYAAAALVFIGVEELHTLARAKTVVIRESGILKDFARHISHCVERCM